jgi:hypothetical protein
MALHVYSQTVSSDDSDKVKMDSIVRRVRSGEKAAILEAANLKPETVVPSLALTAKDKATDPEKTEYARQALRRVKGVEDYLKQKIDQLSGIRTADAAEERCAHIETLALVKSNKAIRTIASYLFDEANVGYAGSDYSVPSNKVAAAGFLDEMNLPGSPLANHGTYEEHIAEWRVWWQKNKEKLKDSDPYIGK